MKPFNNSKITYPGSHLRDINLNIKLSLDKCTFITNIVMNLYKNSFIKKKWHVVIFPLQIKFELMILL